MMVVLLSSKGATWAFYASAGDKVFLVETRSPDSDSRAEALGDMVRECRWMFGDLRIVYMNGEDDWIEILHNGTGHIVGYEPYDGPVPQQRDFYDE